MTAASTNPGPGRVLLAGQVIVVAGLREHPERFAGVFAQSRAQDRCGFCPCSPDRPKLVIRSRASRYHLAC